jgi:hypothetical protein
MSLWLRQAFPIFAIGSAGHDDLLFVRLAANLGAGQWLGPYDNLTMAKGAAYSFFLLGNHFTGLPLKITEQIVYLSVSLYFSTTIGTLFRSRAATLFCFALLAFNPVFWSPDAGGRVVREGLYLSLSLLLITTSIRVFVLKYAASLKEDLHAKLPVLIGFGLTGGVYWLTREEGVWLAPSVFLMAASWFVFNFRPASSGETKTHYVNMLIFLATPVIAFSLVVGIINTINYYKYGRFQNNEFRSADFQAAYGALSRIEHAHWIRYVVFPKDAREKAYSVSASARELKPFFEGEGGERWRKAGCEQTGRTPCPEILAGWFMWALRDAVAAAGHYRNPSEARAFYRRLEHEVNAACDHGDILCGSKNNSLVPPWHPEYFAETLVASRMVFSNLITLGHTPVRIEPSFGSEQQLALFRLITNGPLASREDVCSGSVTYKGIGVSQYGHCSPRNRIRLKVAEEIARFQGTLTTVAVPGAIFIWAVLLVVSVVRRRWHPGHIVVTALIAAIAARVILLGFLEATSIPFNMLYLSPVVPMALALAPCVIFLGITLGNNEEGHRPA